MCKKEEKWCKSWPAEGGRVYMMTGLVFMLKKIHRRKKRERKTLCENIKNHNGELYKSEITGINDGKPIYTFWISGYQT